MRKHSYQRTTPRDFARLVFRHGRKSLLFFAVVIGLTVAALLLLPRKYRSEGKLFVKVGRETVGLDPTATTGQRITLNESRENEINSTIDLLESRAIMEQVVDKLGVATVLNDEDGLAAKTEADERERQLRRDKAIRKLQSDIYVWSPKNSSVIGIEAKANTPELAQRIVDEVMAAYLDHHIKIHRTGGSLEFFTNQAKLLHENWKKATAELRDAKNEMGIISIEGQKKTLQEQVTLIKQQQSGVEAGLASSTAKIKALKQLIAETPKNLITEETRGNPNLARDGMQEELYKLQIAERDLLARFTDEHPQVIAIRVQVDELKKLLDEHPKDRTTKTTGISKTWQEINVELLKEQAIAEGLRSQQQDLARQEAVLQGKLAELNGHEQEIVKLHQKVDRLREDYTKYAKDLEQARIDNALRQDRISNVNIAQAASFAPKPVSPNKPLIAILGLVVAGCGAIAIALLSEYFDHSFQSPDQLESQLDLPALASIPQFPQRHFTLSGRN